MSTLSGAIAVDTDINLSSGTVLKANVTQYDNFNANRTLTFSGNLSLGGPSTRLFAHVSVAPITLTIPSCIREGASSNPTTAISILATGDYELSWHNSHGTIYLIDNVDDATKVGQSFANLSTPTLISIPQVDTSGNVANRTFAQTVADIGAVSIGAIATSGLTIGSGQLAGRSSVGTGQIEAIGIGDGLKISGGLISATAGGASVSDAAFSSSWDGSTTVAPSKNAVWDLFGTSINYPLSTYAVGTAYAMTATPAALIFGTTSPVLALDKAGTYLIFGRANIKYNAATFAANQTATLKLRRTNNTAADLTNGSTSEILRIITTITDTAAVVSLPPVIYTTSNTNDSLTIFGSVSVIPSAGSLDITEASILAILIYGVSDVTAPTQSGSWTISADGVTHTLVFSENVSVGSGGSGGFLAHMSGGDVTLTYSSGTGTSTLVFTGSRTVQSSETQTGSNGVYTQPGNGIEDLSGNDLVTFTAHAITNNSSQSSGWVQRASDDFNYTNGQSLEAASANWIASSGLLNVGLGQIVVNQSPGSLNNYYYGGASFNATQYSRVTLVSGGGGGTTSGVSVRTQSGAFTCYVLWAHGGNLELMKVISGVSTVINSIARSYSSGAKLRLEVTGTGSSTRLAALEDTGSGFTSVWTNQDPAAPYIDGGKPGMFGYNGSQDFNFVAWKGGDQ